MVKVWDELAASVWEVKSVVPDSNSDGVKSDEHPRF
jgi:hypothetical protein